MNCSLRILVIAGLVGVASASLAQDISDLKLVALPEKAQILPGEPLVLRVQLHNPTGEAVKAHRDLSPRYGLLQVSIAAGDGPFRRYFGPRWGTAEGIPKQEDIAAGEMLMDEAVIYYMTASMSEQGITQPQMVLSEPGKYRVMATWHQVDFKSSVKSAPIDIEVVQPTGGDRQAWELMKANPGLSDFLAGQDASAALADQAQAVISASPTGVYAQHFSLEMGRIAARAQEWDKATAHLSVALKAPSQSLLRRQALIEQAGVYVRSNQVPQAKTLLGSAQGDFNGTPQEDLYKRLIAELDRIGG